jgi:hypothetical protein
MPIVPGSIAILPPGALGVSLFYHLTNELRDIDSNVVFVGRKGSSSTEALLSRAVIRIEDSRGLHHVPLAGRLHGDLLAMAPGLPEVMLVCTNPDQLPGVITSLVESIEHAHATTPLAPGAVEMPILLLSANGIYFQRVRQFFVEKLEESTLFGRLPDLWPELMGEIVSHLLRGVTMQTGIREGTGGDAVYRPGAAALTRVGGGSAAVRDRAVALLKARGGWYEAVELSPTRLEFDKALVNIATNLLGQIVSIDHDGNFRGLTVAEILSEKNEPEIRDLARHVVEIGRAMKVYGPEETSDALADRALATARMHGQHVPSSVQWIGLMLRTGALQPEVTPTEKWLLEPLIRYARSAGMEEAAAYFESLRERLVQKLTLCSARQNDRARDA